MTHAVAGPVVHVVHSSTANSASVLAAIARLGARAVLTEDRRDVETAEHLVLPGVGSFGAMMHQLNELRMAGPLRERLAAGRHTLGICLGMQALFEASDESPGVRGLGVVPGVVRRFEAPRVPQLGWNLVSAGPGCRALVSHEAYFANSYRVAEGPNGWAVATAWHGGKFVAAIERGGVCACQFHPELSGPAGAGIIARWLGVEAPAGPVVGVPGSGAGVPPVTPLPRVIPCLDIRDGRIVKGVKFQGLRDAGDPVERAAEYERQGADELVLLDVSATPEGRGHGVETVAAVRRAIGIPLTVGGGVRAPADAQRLLAAGADKVAVNTAAVDRPALINELAERFGVQCTILACDAARRVAADPAGPGWEVVVKSGTVRTGIDAIDWCAEAEKRGAGEVLLTSWDRDGTGEGFDFDLLEAVRARVRVPVIASGGAKTPGHMAGALQHADACLAASMFHDGHYTVGAVKQEITGRTGLVLRSGPGFAG